MRLLKRTSMAALLGVLLCSCAQDPGRSSVVKYGASRGEGSAGVHTVLKGDTLYSVSKRYRLPITEIVTVNKISEPYILRTGYRLKLPPPNEHTVREDDTIVGVARTYSVSPSELVRLNDLSPPYTLSSGQVLRLPTPSVQAEEARYAVPQETVRSAGVSGVQREVLGTSRAGTPTPTSKPQAAQPKPRVQKASAAVQSKVLKEVPKSSGNGKFMRPVEGKIISNYGPKKGGLHNDGINIKAARGAPVRAAENGRVVYVGDDLEGYGNLILVRHEGRYMSAYAHLGKSLVKKGDAVKRGQSIGTVGSSGQVDSPQLHFEIRKGTKALDPQRYL
ncbi:MAG: LysM peptidoglycan-binding domain-containing M23 family metallopeptidase [Alphaproteobacteria bacterium]|nr:LysM peptidoglycan-binding domain-containing M23 family metallopeptidase [Alphaproteobacteria bacterium]